MFTCFSLKTIAVQDSSISLVYRVSYWSIFEKGLSSLLRTGEFKSSTCARVACVIPPELLPIAHGLLIAVMLI